MKEVDCCAECGERKEEHGHEFVPMFIDDRCTCEPESWGNPLSIPAICSAFVNDTEHLGELYCLNCEHNEACHTRAQAAKSAEQPKDSPPPSEPHS
jgi:hypothetical protein